MNVRVIKLGGSLLDLAGLAARFDAWLAVQPCLSNVVLVGGGDMADVVRRAFVRHRLSEEDAHWLCIRILGVTAELAVCLLPKAVLVRRFEDLAAQRRELAVFDCEAFLRETDARSADPLPHSWDVTSDSIAARLARRLRAAELVLLKSALPGPARSTAEAAAAGYVDVHFPSAAAGLPVRCVNLRGEGWPEACLGHGDRLPDARSDAPSP